MTDAKLAPLPSAVHLADASGESAATLIILRATPGQLAPLPSQVHLADAAGEAACAMIFKAGFPQG